MKGNHLIETRLIGQAGLAGTGSIGRVTENLDELPTLPERIRQILNIISSAERKPGYMICFIMYDITSNKVRTLIAKFLLKKDVQGSRSPSSWQTCHLMKCKT